LIISHPLGPRKYLYMFLAYLYIMFNVSNSNRIVVASDNFSDMILLYYAQNFSFYYIGDMRSKYQAKEIENRCGIVPFDSDPLDNVKIAKDCLNFVKQLNEGRK